MRIACARVDHAPFGVDTPADLERARRELDPDGEDCMTGLIAFQGQPGRLFRPRLPHRLSRTWQTLPCETFEAAIEAVRDGRARSWPCCPARTAWPAACRTSTTCCRQSGLFVVGEHFQRVEHCLLAPQGATIETLKRAHSHAVALGQVRRLLRSLALHAGGGGRHRRRGRAGGRNGTIRRTRRSPRRWPPRSTGWRSCARNVEDAAHNTTRFYVDGDAGRAPAPDDAGDLMTTFVFRVRNVPAALYKALGGFATNGVNMTKLESYMVDGQFTATQFLCDVDGHPGAAGAAAGAGGAVVLLARAACAGGLSGGAVPAGAGGASGGPRPGRSGTGIKSSILTPRAFAKRARTRTVPCRRPPSICLLSAQGTVATRRSHRRGQL